MQEKSEFVRAIAIGGPFLEGNVITVGSLGDPVTWNSMPILMDQRTSSRFNFKEGNVSVEISQSNHSLNVADLAKENRGIDITLPLGINLTVNRLQQHLNVAITMPQQEGGQEG